MINTTDVSAVSWSAPDAGALLSDCGTYRYRLTRANELAAPTRGPALFIMLNPSTADATDDDATIRRCRGFARTWGCAGLVVANLFALRSRNPGALSRHSAPVGPLNDDTLRTLAAQAGDVVCAWGGNQAAAGRSREVAAMLTESGARLWCLGTTKRGAPRHPLFVRGDQTLIPWEAPGD